MKKLLFASFILLAACRGTRTSQVSSDEQGMLIHGKTFATVYQQSAAEYRALCYQAFNAARWSLDAFEPKTNKPKAIVTDIDETILDNSDYAAHQSALGKDYDTESWYQWTSQSNAMPIPGAAAFLQYASSKGVEIFYISNRDDREKQSTIVNLKKYNLPNSDEAHVLLRKESSGKEGRRQIVSQTHEIIMLMGDNLPDFSALYDKKSMTDRNRQSDLHASAFGQTFIVLPNPVYGDWEGSLYKYQYSMPAVKKDSALRSILRSY